MSLGCVTMSGKVCKGSNLECITHKWGELSGRAGLFTDWRCLFPAGGEKEDWSTNYDKLTRQRRTWRVVSSYSIAGGRQSEWCPAWDSHTSLQGRGGDQTILQFFFLPISVKDSEFVIPAADFAGGSSQIQYWLKCRALYWCIQYDWHCMCLAVALGGGSKAFWKTRTFHADFQYSLLQVVKLEITHISMIPWRNGWRTTTMLHPSPCSE